MKRVFKNKTVTFIIILAWISLFFINRYIDIKDMLCAKGISIIHGEYYRYITASCIHYNFIHLVANVLALYWVGDFLESKVGSFRFLSVGLIGSILSQAIFSIIYSNSESAGGSTVIFALIGFIAFLQIFRRDFPRFKLGTWYGNWIIVYAILANIPFMSFMNLSTIIIHLLAFIVGFLLSMSEIFMVDMPKRI